MDYEYMLRGDPSYEIYYAIHSYMDASVSKLV